LVHEKALRGVATWDETLWTPFMTELAGIIGFPVPGAGAQSDLAGFLSFNEEGIVQHAGGARTSFVLGDIRLNLGSIHSVKGRSVDSILIVETEVFKGGGANQRAMDLAAVLPQAFGIGQIDFNANEAHFAAATNIFVGVTRARSLLALGVRKQAITDDLIARAAEQGWIIRDLTAG
jgi:hypothetical protein